MECQLDEKDREILQMLQNGFPLVAEPYKAIGDKLWIDEYAVISRIVRLIQNGVIRYVGPFFDSRKLGYKGCLAAMNVPEERVDEVAAVINRFDEVTHNYLREGTPNVWFTLITNSPERQKEILDSIKKESGIDEIKLFSSKKYFKVKVDL
ncbi:MAG: Lrp/AsnC family transcriptional regulator [Candidatus Riflebacteria bacterium]|jgi:DNA-binding Lrp family transcriptional regulator|nr:Lrp/AsnC family transcriptional regulator [Candidatus Riflebacteria bacterium]